MVSGWKMERLGLPPATSLSVRLVALPVGWEFLWQMIFWWWGWADDGDELMMGMVWWAWKSCARWYTLKQTPDLMVTSNQWLGNTDSIHHQRERKKEEGVGLGKKSTAKHIYSYPDVNKRLAERRKTPLWYCQLSPSTNNLNRDDV